METASVCQAQYRTDKLKETVDKCYDFISQANAQLSDEWIIWDNRQDQWNLALMSVRIDDVETDYEKLYNELTKPVKTISKEVLPVKFLCFKWNWVRKITTIEEPLGSLELAYMIAAKLTEKYEKSYIPLTFIVEHVTDGIRPEEYYKPAVDSKGRVLLKHCFIRDERMRLCLNQSIITYFSIPGVIEPPPKARDEYKELLTTVTALKATIDFCDSGSISITDKTVLALNKIIKLNEISDGKRG